MSFVSAVGCHFGVLQPRQQFATGMSYRCASGCRSNHPSARTMVSIQGSLRRGVQLVNLRNDAGVNPRPPEFNAAA
jgi:hypothetical protein